MPSLHTHFYKSWNRWACITYTSHWGQLPYDNNDENGRLDGTNTSIIKENHTKGPPFAHLPKLRIYFLAFLNVHTREKEYLSLMYTMYANASNNTAYYTHVSLSVVWRVHPQRIGPIGWDPQTFIKTSSTCKEPPIASWDVPPSPAQLQTFTISY